MAIHPRRVIVVVVSAFVLLVVATVIIRQWLKLRARKKSEEAKAGDDFPPMRRLTVRRGKVVPVLKRRWSGVGSSIFGDRKRPGSRFSSVTDLEKAESHRSRSPFGIWPSSSYRPQADDSNELSTNDRSKRTSTRESNMEYLRDVDRQFLRQLSPVHESGRKSQMSELSHGIPSTIDARHLSEEKPSKRPPKSSTHAIEEIEEPNLPPRRLTTHTNPSEEAIATPTSPVFRRLGLSSNLSLPKSKFSSSNLFRRSQSSANPSSLSATYPDLPTPTFPEQTTTSLPTTPRSLYSPFAARQTEKSSPLIQNHSTSPSTLLSPPSASAILRQNSGISAKSPSPYGTVSTTITATNPIPLKSRSRSKSTSPTRKSRSRSRSRTKSSLKVSRSPSRSKSRGRSPHPIALSEEPKAATPAHSDASSLSLGGRSTTTNLIRLSSSDTFSPFTVGQAQPINTLSSTSILPRSTDQENHKQLPRLPPAGMTPPVSVLERHGDDVVRCVARSQSKKGRVLRKQSRNSSKGRKPQIIEDEE